MSLLQQTSDTYIERTKIEIIIVKTEIYDTSEKNCAGNGCVHIIVSCKMLIKTVRICVTGDGREQNNRDC